MHHLQDLYGGDPKFQTQNIPEAAGADPAESEPDV